MTGRFPVSIKAVLLDQDIAPKDSVWLALNDRAEWELPGGRLEAGEQPPDCLRREVAEELGLNVAVGAILGSWVFEPIPQHPVVIIAYACQRLGQEDARLSAEHRAIARHPVVALAHLPLPGVYRHAIAEALCR
ncbi:MAG: NUDIX domain-containing protein [Alphaproteobacteria bacterium]|nr:NUDIX domain-containing protein [Alphaproteobacteria bacterium]TAD90297.1 MAG: NUDIX domain-containing protein [Alphaproteobacteria bacterium]